MSDRLIISRKQAQAILAKPGPGYADELDLAHTVLWLYDQLPVPQGIKTKHRVLTYPELVVQLLADLGDLYAAIPPDDSEPESTMVKLAVVSMYNGQRAGIHAASELVRERFGIQ